MFSHDDIWAAIDRLARSLSTSPSGLAKQAGLDPTSFNKSKRIGVSGKARWPSTESVAKILSVAGLNFEDFAALAADRPARGPVIPVIGLAQAGDGGFFDDSGYPVGEGWDEVRMPGEMDEKVYALEIHGDSMWPVFRDGDRVLVAPNETVRKGDRVVVKTQEGEILAKELIRQTTTKIELKSLNAEYDDRNFSRKEIAWMARIVWVTQ
ncbi:MAG: helix-turn-helix transcriptional regulator [Hellea sp.]|nr:helix-turn-helix transcriptional regulator [Hellea sp.]